MSFLRFLRGRPGEGGTAAGAAGRPGASPAGPRETETVRRIVARLESLPPERARLLAATAYVLARAAYADLEISEAETAAMERELAGRGGLDEAQAVLVVEMAKLQERSTGETSDFLVTREFAEIATVEQRIELLRACYHVAVADESISGAESATLDQIASELGLERQDAAAVRAEFADKIAARMGFSASQRGSGA